MKRHRNTGASEEEEREKKKIAFYSSVNFVYSFFPLIIVPIQNITILEAMQDPELTDHSFVLPAVMEGNSLTATCIAIGGKRIINSAK